MRGSADIVHHGKITRRGNNISRWVLTEAVHTHVTRAPNSPLSLFYYRLGKKRGLSKAAVAAAAKLLKFVYWMLTTGKDFDTLVSERAKDLEIRKAAKCKMTNSLVAKKKRKRVKDGEVSSARGKTSPTPTGNDKK